MQVMVTVAIMGIASLALVSISNQMSIMSSRANTKIQEHSAISILRAYLADEKICREALSLDANPKFDKIKMYQYIARLQGQTSGLLGRMNGNDFDVVEAAFDFGRILDENHHPIENSGLGKLEAGVMNEQLGLNVERVYVKAPIFVKKGPFQFEKHVGVLMAKFARKGQNLTDLRDKEIGAFQMILSPGGKILRCSSSAQELEFNFPIQNLALCNYSYGCAEPANGPNREEYIFRNNEKEPNCDDFLDCLVVDFFLRNQGTEMMARDWMAHTTDWKSQSEKFQLRIGPIGQINSISTVLGIGMGSLDIKKVEKAVAALSITVPEFSYYFSNVMGIKMLNKVFGHRALVEFLKLNPMNVAKASANVNDWAQAMEYRDSNDFLANQKEISRLVGFLGIPATGLNNITNKMGDISKLPALLGAGGMSGSSTDDLGKSGNEQIDPQQLMQLIQSLSGQLSGQ